MLPHGRASGAAELSDHGARELAAGPVEVGGPRLWVGWKVATKVGEEASQVVPIVLLLLRAEGAGNRQLGRSAEDWDLLLVQG